MQVFLNNRIVEPDGRVKESTHTYDGTWFRPWFRQGTGHYLVYDDEGIHTTVRWDPLELRLYRKGEQLEAYQVFRPNCRDDFELSVPGSTLHMSSTTTKFSELVAKKGADVLVAYHLACGPSSLGDFTLTIRVAVR